MGVRFELIFTVRVGEKKLAPQPNSSADKHTHRDFHSMLTKLPQIIHTKSIKNHFMTCQLTFAKQQPTTIHLIFSTELDFRKRTDQYLT
jgi:hypothetical protein